MSAPSVTGNIAARNLMRMFGKLRSQKHLADAAVTFTVRVLSAFLAFGVQVLLARTLDLGDYGIYVTLWTWLIVVNHIAAFGFSESSIRFLPRYTQRRKYHWARGFLVTGYRVVILGSTLAAVIGIVLLTLADDLLPQSYLLPMIVLLIGLPFTSLEIYLEGVSRSYGWFMLTIVPAYILRPLVIAGGAIGCVLMGHKPDATIILGFGVFCTAIIVIVQAIIIRSRLNKMFPDAKSSGPKKLWLLATLPLTLTLAVDEIFTWSDILILGFLVSPEDVSVYFAAQRSMSLAAFIQYAFMLVMVRDFSLANAIRDKSALQKKISNASNWTFWLTVPAVTLTLAGGYPLLWLFGPHFVSGYAIMFVLGIGYIMRAAVGQAQDLMIVLGYQKANIAISSGCILLNVVMSIILIPSFGIMGAALATMVTYVVRSIAFAFAAYRLAGLWVLAGVPSFSLGANDNTSPFVAKEN